MAEIKYAGEAAVSKIADYVNAKLAIVSSMPVSPILNQTVLYTGADANPFFTGSIYKYNGSDWIAINDVRTIELTQAEYDLLPKAVKENGAIYFIIDGQGGSGICIKYVDVLPTTDIENIIYGIESTLSYSLIVEDSFLDDNELFSKVEGVDEYEYIAAEGVDLTASTDNITYKSFESLEYDEVNLTWTLTYKDGTTESLVDQDRFYYQRDVDLFYAGNSQEQRTIQLVGGGAGGGGNIYVPGEGIEIINNAISVLPATSSSLGGVKPDNKTLEVTATGILKGNYQSGHGIKINENIISDRIFVGTMAEWEALTSDEQEEFDTVTITDDATPMNYTSGHLIINNTGVEIPQRQYLKLGSNLVVTDDPINNATNINADPYTAGRKIEISNQAINVDDTVKGTFIGTKDAWDALSITDKAKYEIVNITDDEQTGSAVVDTIAIGNSNAVSSNGVAAYLQSKSWLQELNVTTADAGIIKAGPNTSDTLAFGKWIITLLTLTDTSDCASQYIVKNSAVTVIHEGQHQNAPRLVVDTTNNCYTVILNGQTQLYDVTVKVESLNN